MYPHQVERLGDVLEREDIAALVAATPANVLYLTGFRSLSQAMYPRTPVFAVYAASGTALVIPAIDAPAVAAGGIDVDHVFAYGEFFMGFADDHGGALGDTGRRTRAWTSSAAATAGDALAAALDALGIKTGAVGLDDAQLGHDVRRRASERLAPLVVRPATASFAHARIVKSPYEIECLDRALHVAEESLNAVIQMLKPGMTERDAVRRYEEEVGERGGTPEATVIASGDRSALPTIDPSERAIRTGDLVRFDLGCVWKGFRGRVARTAVMGEPTERQQRVHEALQAGVEAAIDTISAGAIAGNIFDAAVAAVRGGGIPEYQRHHVGHGIGLEPYEPPVLERGGHVEIALGAVVTVETPYYEIGWGGANLKDTVLVIRGGARVLNRSARGLVVLD